MGQRGKKVSTLVRYPKAASVEKSGAGRDVNDETKKIPDRRNSTRQGSEAGSSVWTKLGVSD